MLDFDRIQVSREFKVFDPVSRTNLVVCTFEGQIMQKDQIINRMTINYPVIYEENKLEATRAYRDFVIDLYDVAMRNNFVIDDIETQLSEEDLQSNSNKVDNLIDNITETVTKRLLEAVSLDDIVVVDGELIDKITQGSYLRNFYRGNGDSENPNMDRYGSGR